MGKTLREEIVDAIVQGFSNGVERIVTQPMDLWDETRIYVRGIPGPIRVGAASVEFPEGMDRDLVALIRLDMATLFALIAMAR